jgi:hypothetical protein
LTRKKRKKKWNEKELNKKCLLAHLPNWTPSYGTAYFTLRRLTTMTIGWLNRGNILSSINIRMQPSAE